MVYRSVVVVVVISRRVWLVDEVEERARGLTASSDEVGRQDDPGLDVAGRRGRRPGTAACPGR